jgi:hypothetical protein
VRWQPIAVTAALLAPPVLLAAAVWPEGGIGGDGGDDVEAELGEGDSEVATTDGFTSTDFLIVGPGQLRIDVEGPGWDPTLTLIDPDSGEQLAYNDDFQDLNPSLAVQLDDGEVVRAQVRSLGGPPGGRFEISVSATEDLPDVDGDDVGVGVGGGVDPGGPLDGTIPDLPVTVVGDLAAGAEAEGTTGDGSITAYRLTGPGELQVDVVGDGFDPTLRVVDDATGDELAFNDDSGGGLDPSLAIVLAEGQVAVVEVGVFGGGGGGDYTIRVGAPGQSATTIVVG